MHAARWLLHLTLSVVNAPPFWESGACVLAPDAGYGR